MSPGILRGIGTTIRLTGIPGARFITILTTDIIITCTIIITDIIAHGTIIATIITTIFIIVTSALILPGLVQELITVIIETPILAPI